MYHRNIFESSSKVFGNLRKFWEIFGKCPGTFVWPLEQFWKIFGRWSEIFGKSSKTPSSAGLYNKKNITRRLEDMNFIFAWQKQYFTHSLRSFGKYCFCHSKIKFISPRHRVISSMYFFCRQLTDFFLPREPGFPQKNFSGAPAAQRVAKRSPIPI